MHAAYNYFDCKIDACITVNILGSVAASALATKLRKILKSRDANHIDGLFLCVFGLKSTDYGPIAWWRYLQ